MVVTNNWAIIWIGTHGLLAELHFVEADEGNWSIYYGRRSSRENNVGSMHSGKLSNIFFGSLHRKQMGNNALNKLDNIAHMNTSMGHRISACFECFIVIVFGDPLPVRLESTAMYNMPLIFPLHMHYMHRACRLR